VISASALSLLALKLDTSGGLLRQFVDLNNQVLGRFSEAERTRIGVHSCRGGDHDSTHSADVAYDELLPVLFDHKAGAFYLELAGEHDPESVLQAISANLRPGQRVFVGVIDPIDPEVETREQVQERVLLAARYIPLDQFGTTDDCGFSPFADDRSTARETAFAKIRARVEGTRLAAEQLGV
jgi:5-methyltetrahydropteroyltriglutamate--homocysteine methyltransferase